MQDFKNQLITHLQGGSAFMPVEELLKFISSEEHCRRPKALPYSFYEIFYHMRFAQKDILEYIKDKDYTTHEWPQDYWPKKNMIDSLEEWELLKSHFFEEQQELIGFLQDTENDLLKPVSKGTEHTLLREVLLVIEHNAYHSGQLLIVLRSLGLYPA
ncbi:DinB family protein [Gillisia hiemivivida]|uniref:DinB family protein n=1 Tax=Gillisia hiemivivida TaxID=291190 RepID=A0A5C6ZWF3_9FLAO|nr:DinB family protein [Gillisia hiemivivida]TXD94316.1 DinB family protein [Gillisia hiemivivida]